MPGIIFVLAIDKEQLSGAINGFYGSDKINSVEYLGRFIDIEYTIPEPATGVFCEYMVNYYEFDDFFRGRSIHTELRGERDALISIATLLFNKDQIPLRQQAKIIAHARLSLKTVDSNHYLFPEIFFMLIYLKNINKTFYDKIRAKKLANQDFINELGSVFPQDIDEYNTHDFIYLEADLARYYENYVNDGRRQTRLLNEVTRGTYTLAVKSSFGTEKADNKLLQALTDHQRSEKGGISLKVIFERVDLIEQLVK